MHNHQVRQVFRTWDLNQQEFVQRNWECEQQCSCRSTSFEQILVGEMKYIYKITQSLDEE